MRGQHAVSVCGLKTRSVFDLILLALSCHSGLSILRAFIFLLYISGTDCVIDRITMTTSPECTGWCWLASLTPFVLKALVFFFYSHCRFHLTRLLWGFLFFSLFLSLSNESGFVLLA